MSELTTTSLQELDWDTSFLGRRTARLGPGECDVSEGELQRCLMEAEKRGVELVYFFSQSSSVERELPRGWVGAKPVEEKVTYSKSVSVDEPLPEVSSVIRRFRPSDAERLINLSLRSSHQSRFRVDPRMDRWCSQAGSPPVADRLYTQWMKKSMTGELADEILVVEHQSQVAGMVTLSCDGTAAKIVLVAVDPEYRGLRLGTALCESAESWAATMGASLLRVVTQRSNGGACSFYQNLGFVESSSVSVYHFWRVRAF